MLATNIAIHYCDIIYDNIEEYSINPIVWLRVGNLDSLIIYPSDIRGS